MSEIIISFSPEEVQCILRISLDNDKGDALDFIKNCLEKKIKLLVLKEARA